MKSTQLNTEALVELCKSGDQAAQLELYRRYYKLMYNASFRIVKNSYDAEDIMQDAFLMAFTKLNTLNDNTVFGSWLKRIVINNSFHHFNKNKKNLRVPIENALSEMKETTNGTDSDEEKSDLQVRQVLKAINTLKDNYRIALTLNLIDGYDYEEISEIMGMSYGNCRTTISRAKERLRQKLKEVMTY
ncbi:RNA polymerase sigma factor [Aestuariivivens sediminicola]|uniref:RNA polymerase sigma factor n=1 Tax=Aestuariivivens sediminicola TaxID=2913560 RepID=UPI001F597C23|nr:RNA polymerase sigma factor [Aestuariivivens sediminicola]